MCGLSLNNLSGKADQLQKGLVMNKHSWLVALAPLLVMACSNGIVGKGGATPSHPDGGTNPQQPLTDTGSGQPVAQPDQAKSSLAYNSAPVVATGTESAVVNRSEQLRVESSSKPGPQ